MTDGVLHSAPVIQKGFAKPFFFSLVTLVSGIVIGVAATTLLTEKTTAAPEDLPDLEWLTERTVWFMTRDLRLNPDQIEQVRPIVHSHLGAIDKIREEAKPLIREEFEMMNNELFTVLDERQQGIWDNSIQRMQGVFPSMNRRGDQGPGRGDQGSGRGGMGSGGFRGGSRDGQRSGETAPDFRSNTYPGSPGIQFPQSGFGPNTYMGSPMGSPGTQLPQSFFDPNMFSIPQGSQPPQQDFRFGTYPWMQNSQSPQQGQPSSPTQDRRGRRGNPMETPPDSQP